MARKLRFQYPGAIYHVMSRGDRREDIFVDDKDRTAFLGKLGQAGEKTGWQAHAYGLMSNHFPLLVVSSYPAYLGAERAPWLRVDRVLGECGIPADTPAGRQPFEQVMEKRRCEADGQDYPGLKRGWGLGSEEFRQELLREMPGRIGTNHFGPERRESAEAPAQRIVAVRLSELGLTAAPLEELPANATVKVELARRWRRQTTLSLKRIAEQLGVGRWKYLSNLVGKETPKRGELELGL